VDDTGRPERIQHLTCLEMDGSEPLFTSHGGLYTILPLPILCGIHCSHGGTGGNLKLRNRVEDSGGGCLNRVRKE